MEQYQDTIGPRPPIFTNLEGAVLTPIIGPAPPAGFFHEAEDVEYEEVHPKDDRHEKSSPPAMAQDIRHMYDNLFEHLNKTYNLNVKYDPESPMASMQSLIDGTNSAAMTIYVNEGMKKSILLLIPTLMSAIMELSRTTLTPETFKELSYENKVVTLEKLVGWMEKLTAISEQVNRNQGTEILRTLRQEEDTSSMMDNPKVMEFLQQYAQDMKDKG